MKRAYSFYCEIPERFGEYNISCDFECPYPAVLILPAYCCSGVRQMKWSILCQGVVRHDIEADCLTSQLPRACGACTVSHRAVQVSLGYPLDMRGGL